VKGIPAGCPTAVWAGGNLLGYALCSEMFIGPARPVNTGRFSFLDPRARDFLKLLGSWAATAAQADPTRATDGT
jgi:hypothetical protein